MIRFDTYIDNHFDIICYATEDDEYSWQVDYDKI